MTTRASLALRWGRATVLAAVAASTGVLAHLSAGGLLPGAAGLVPIFGVSLVWSAALLGRPATTRRIVLMVMASQTFTHGALTAVAGHRGDHRVGSLARSAATPSPLRPPPRTPVTVMDGGHRAPWSEQMHAANPAAGAPVQLSVPAPVAHLVADFTGPHAAMAVAHLVGAALLGLWLARGERLVWSLVALSARTGANAISALVTAMRCPAALGHLGRVRRTATVSATDAEASRPVRWFTPAAALRGPPVLAGA